MSEVNIVFQRNINVQDFINFNVESFPERDALTQKLITFRYFNPLNTGNFIENNVIALDNDGKICAQALYHPARYYLKNELHDFEWGFDLYVSPNKRNDSLGLHLFEYIKENKHAPIFASGVGEKALKIESFFGYHVIGYLKKYYKLVNPFYLLSGLIVKSNLNNSRYPDRLIVGKEFFEKTKAMQQWLAGAPYNNNLLEFDRSQQFMNWRFFSDDFNYAVYRRIGAKPFSPPIYFVVRTVKIKHLTCLLLVDYRYDTKQVDDFKLIIKVVNKLAAKLLLPVVVTGSSLKISDAVLELNNFKITGKDRPIICNIKEYKQYKNEIKNRDFIFSTLADSDGEYLM
ncbi:hypothetical protein [Mucilaginibacter sp. UR6-11]|uniref:hypothetical protein n=1 Tax=Mucilaginibacter sp. UR6-11 TaxID=1435644 RepID=UPI001E588134|nr:hypothetical protein [Mucilaginibacter sp. UR6-11]MCC8424864.1 hypothetical protein [Mucilaginibacter sp. UR6-11]